jgi:uncharacterized membrane-anchored protein YitT (DUF2179 family)
VSGWPKSIFPAMVLFGCFLVIVFLFDSSLNFGLFRVFFPQIANFSFRDVVVHFYEPNLFASIIRGIFTATALGVVLRFLKTTGEKN